MAQDDFYRTVILDLETMTPEQLAEATRAVSDFQKRPVEAARKDAQRFNKMSNRELEDFVYEADRPAREAHARKNHI
jgi:hypothetical protein